MATTKQLMAKEMTKEELILRIRNIITTYYDLDSKGNPTIPTEHDVGQVDVDQFSVEIVDKVWELLNKCEPLTDEYWESHLG